MAFYERTYMYPALQSSWAESFRETNMEYLNFTDCVNTAFALGVSTWQGFEPFGAGVCCWCKISIRWDETWCYRLGQSSAVLGRSSDLYPVLLKAPKQREQVSTQQSTVPKC